MERLVDDVLAQLPIQVTWRRPALDLYEKDDAFVVRAELPGVEKDKIDLSVTGDRLTIKAARKEPVGVKDEQYQISELEYGDFSRTITLPAEVNAAGIEATHDNGMLEIHLPKARGAKATRVHVKDKGAA
jgi:HSP20 family protein